MRQVNGRITDEFGQPVAFATIQISGSNLGTTSDANGNYSINIPQGYGILNYNFIGYQSVQLNASATRMDVVMAESGITLDEATVETLSTFDMNSDMVESMPGNSNSGSLFRKREERARVDMDYAAVKVAYSPTQTRFTVDANYNIPSNGSHYLCEGF